eukprot:7626069-Pyramimonas_sp.AAC.1
MVFSPSCLRQVPPPCQPSPLGGGCSNDSGYDDVNGNDAGDATFGSSPHFLHALSHVRLLSSLVALSLSCS